MTVFPQARLREDSTSGVLKACSRVNGMTNNRGASVLEFYMQAHSSCRAGYYSQREVEERRYRPRYQGTMITRGIGDTLFRGKWRHLRREKTLHL